MQKLLQKYIQMNMLTKSHLYIHLNTYFYRDIKKRQTHIHIYIYIYTHIYPHSQTIDNTEGDKLIYTHIHTHTHTHTHINIQTLPFPPTQNKQTDAWKQTHTCV